MPNYLARSARTIVLALALALPAAALAANDILMHRDPGCGCCMSWAVQVRKAFGRDVVVVDDADRAAFQRRVGLPPALASCHTAIVDGIAFEGHVPIADMKRVLATRPKGVSGLAVPGMPIGSTGMEVPGRSADRYSVIAFGKGAPVVFARH